MNGNEHPRPQHLNSSTYVSVGLLVTILVGFAWVIKGQTDNASDMRLLKLEFTSQMDKFDSRLKNFETAKNSWTAVDMYQWAIHLQQLNSDSQKLQKEGLKVPEPQVTK